MPQDRTPMSQGLAHPPPVRARIPQPKPRADDDLRELVPNQQTTVHQPRSADTRPADAAPPSPAVQPAPERAEQDEEAKPQPPGGHTDFVQTPD